MRKLEKEQYTPRIAICLSGQPRNYVEGFKNLYSVLLSKYNIDVFIHTWRNREFSQTDFKLGPISKYTVP